MPLGRVTCKCCGAPLPPQGGGSGIGRRRLFCSDRCRKAHPSHVRLGKACPRVTTPGQARAPFSVRLSELEL